MSIDNLEKEFDLDNYFPRDVSYSKEKRAIYDNLQTDSISPLKDKLLADVFLYSAIFGFKNNEKKPLDKPVPQIPSNAFSDSYKSLLLAMVVSSSPKGVDVLLDKEEVRKTLEQYANGGIKILEHYLTEGKVGDALTNLETKMRELLKSDSKSETKQSLESRLEDIERTPEAMKQLSIFETHLRYLIPKVLAQKTENWTDSLPNKAILKEWEKDKERSKNALEQYDRAEKFDLIDFSHLGQLRDIIVNTTLWELFEPIFGNNEVFKSNMIEITMIRNDPAHARGLTATQLDVLKSMLIHRNEQIEKALEKLD